MKVNEILAALPSLSQSDLAKVRSTIKFLETKTEKEEVRWHELYNCIYNKTIERGIDLPPRNVFLKNTYFKKFEEAADAVELYTYRVLPNLDKVRRRRLYLFYAEILLDYLEEADKGITQTSVSVYARNIPYLVDRAFPGYAAAGFLNRILG
jgi:hypothetical protein